MEKDNYRGEIIEGLRKTYGSISNVKEVVMESSSGKRGKNKIIELKEQAAELKKQVNELKSFKSSMDGINVYIEESGIKEITGVRNSAVLYLHHLQLIVETLQTKNEKLERLLNKNRLLELLKGLTSNRSFQERGFLMTTESVRIDLTEAIRNEKI
ncbi:MAG: hypothetical protein ABIH79_01120 [archaeon]